jgi:hypothetical protein
VNNGNGGFTCTIAGRFPNPENCSKYYLCILTSPGNLYVTNLTCPNELVFDPSSQTCTAAGSSSCATTTVPTTTTTEPSNSCKAPGFYCNSDTSYTSCADANVPIVINTSCPEGYFCNAKCAYPCLNILTLC